MLETARKTLKSKPENISRHSALKAKVKSTGTREVGTVHNLSRKLFFPISQYKRGKTKTNKQRVSLHNPSSDYELIATGDLSEKNINGLDSFPATEEKGRNAYSKLRSP